MYCDNSKFIIRLYGVDLISIIGLFFSCLSIILIANNLFAYGLSILLLAMLADGYDGWLARKLNQQRGFGRFLDSEIDVVTHLLAPMIFFYQWGMSTWYYAIVLFIVITAGIVRLAVFNDIGIVKTKEGDKSAYLGMPVFWFPFVAVLFFLLSSVFHQIDLYPVAAVVLVYLAHLMVSCKRYYKPGSIIGITLTMLPIIGLIFVWPHLPESFFEWVGIIFLLTIPFVVGAFFHLLSIQYNVFSFLKKPIQASWFGRNKTWRGVVLMTIFTALGVWVGQQIESCFSVSLHYRLTDISIFSTGLLLGLAFILGELPNSFIKRRLGIEAGQLPKRYKVWMVIGDQIDSVLPIALVYFIYFKMDWNELFILILTLPLSFFLWRVVLFITGLKSSAFR